MTVSRLVLGLWVLVCWFPRAAAAQPACANPQSTEVFHAYSTCAADGFWHVITLEYVRCGDGSVQGRQIDDVRTTQACTGQNAVPATQIGVGRGLVPVVGPADQPQPAGHFVFLECINGTWHRVKYLRFRARDGSIRIDPKPVNTENTGQLCPIDAQGRAPLPVQGATGVNPPRGDAPATPAQPATPPPAGGQVMRNTLSGVVVAMREDDQKRTTLLVGVPQTAAGQKVDEVRLELPRQATFRSAMRLPAGWQAKLDGRRLVATGPAQDAPLYLKTELNVAPKDRVMLQYTAFESRAAGRKVGEQRVPIEMRPPLRVRTELDGILTLPPVVEAGETVTAAALEPTLTPAGGLWEINAAGATIHPEPSPSTGATPATQFPTLSFRVPGEWKRGGVTMRVAYTDPWGDLTVNAPQVNLKVLEPAPAAAAAITGCTERTFLGRVACVCGSFPESVRNSIRFGDTPLGAPVSGSSRVLYYLIPDQVPIGGAEFKLPSGDGAARMEVLQLSGAVDRDKLFRGESTSIQISIAGTNAPLQVKLRNDTPGIISLSGGDDQVITTSGGAANSYTGNVRGISVGDFKLTYELAASRCPCAQASGSTPDQPQGETWYDDAMKAFREARERANAARDAALDGEESDKLAGEALDALQRARELVQKGVAAGQIGAETAQLFEEYINGYETMVRTRPRPPSGPAVSVTAQPTVSVAPEKTPASTRPPEQPVTIVTEGWFQPTQGVFQDDEHFKDKPGKQLTKISPTRWTAELPMIVGRPTVLAGIRDDTGAPIHQRIYMGGETTATVYVPLAFRFTRIQGGKRTIVYQSAATKYVPLDGPAGPKKPWSASLWVDRGLPEVPNTFTFEPGPYQIEAELVRDNGAPTGLKVTVDGDAVVRKGPDVVIVAGYLSDASAAQAPVLEKAAQTLAVGAQERLPIYFPVAPRGVTVVTGPPEDLRDIEPGSLRAFVAKLPLTDSIEKVRRDRLMAAIDARFGTASQMANGVKTYLVVTPEDFGGTITPGAAAYAVSDKVMVGLPDTYPSTVAHELTHSIPFCYADEEMIALFGFSYHNLNDQGYGAGIELAGYYREIYRNRDAMMGPKYEYPWITQGSYWHLLNQFRTPPDPELIVVRGYIARTAAGYTAAFSPMYQVTSDAALEAGTPGTNQFAIVLRGDGGKEIARYPFSVAWRIPDVDHERTLVSFGHRVPDSTAVREVQLVGPGGAVLASRQRSARPPVVRITTPAAQARVTATNNRVRVEWTASDPDGDRLTYVVLYSPDGERWRPIANEHTTTSIDVPVRGRPSGARVRVIASDGTRSSQAEVALRLR